MLQSKEWDKFLRKEAKDGNEDAQYILDWMKRNSWLRSQRHLKPRPSEGFQQSLYSQGHRPTENSLLGVKPKIEV